MTLLLNSTPRAKTPARTARVRSTLGRFFMEDLHIKSTTITMQCCRFRSEADIVTGDLVHPMGPIHRGSESERGDMRGAFAAMPLHSLDGPDQHVARNEGGEISVEQHAQSEDAYQNDDGPPCPRKVLHRGSPHCLLPSNPTVRTGGPEVHERTQASNGMRRKIIDLETLARGAKPSARSTR